ncbi:MAG: TIGR04283 family arsenosugar biosynthesis glycosyltransferase [Rhodobacteraceae bacterium]|nr:TIGR04283 family arsenosugar biosynthesis glycosyltransferase [Paracoccaceae bacterium]
MRAPISVVVPSLNAGPGFAAMLAALTPGLSEGLLRELVVSDGGSTDDTLAIAEAAGARVIRGARGRGGQLRRGVAAAEGAWLLVLHADTQLAPDWPEAVRAHLTAHPDRAGYFWLRFRASGLAPRMVAGGANLRSRFFGLPYGDQGLLIPRALYDSAGGYPDIPLMEDAALARALKGRLVPLAAVATTSAARYRNRGWARQTAANLWRLLRWRLGASPDQLARDYAPPDGAEPASRPEP